MFFGDTVIPGTLNACATAQAFLKMRPYTVYLLIYGNDFCGVMDAPLPYKDEEVYNGWLNGDIDFATDSDRFRPPGKIIGPD